MLKFCQKENCDNLCNSRSKYCDEHKKRKCIEDNIRRIEREHEKEKLTEERALKQQQEEEYELNKLQDLKIEEEKELEKAILESKKIFIEEKKKEIEPEPDFNLDNFKLKFKLPNGKTITRTFYPDTRLKNILTYLKIYFYSHKISIDNFSLILNFPKRELTEKENEIMLKDIVSEKNILFYIKNLD